MSCTAALASIRRQRIRTPGSIPLYSPSPLLHDPPSRLRRQYTSVSMCPASQVAVTRGHDETVRPAQPLRCQATRPAPGTGELMREGYQIGWGNNLPSSRRIYHCGTPGALSGLLLLLASLQTARRSSMLVGGGGEPTLHATQSRSRRSSSGTAVSTSLQKQGRRTRCGLCWLRPRSMAALHTFSVVLAQRWLQLR
jgi:hypothetical protein